MATNEADANLAVRNGAAPGLRILEGGKAFLDGVPGVVEELHEFCGEDKVGGGLARFKYHEEHFAIGGKEVTLAEVQFSGAATVYEPLANYGGGVEGIGEEIFASFGSSGGE